MNFSRRRRRLPFREPAVRAEKEVDVRVGKLTVPLLPPSLPRAPSAFEKGGGKRAKGDCNKKRKGRKQKKSGRVGVVVARSLNRA